MARKKTKTLTNKYKQRVVVAVPDEPKKSAPKPPFEVGDELTFNPVFHPTHSIKTPCFALAITEDARFVSGYSVKVKTVPEGFKEMDSWHFSKKL